VATNCTRRGAFCHPAKLLSVGSCRRGRDARRLRRDRLSLAHWRRTRARVWVDPAVARAPPRALGIGWCSRTGGCACFEHHRAARARDTRPRSSRSYGRSCTQGRHASTARHRIKALASATSIGFGGSCGREGPIVQIGATIGSVLGAIVHAPVPIVRTLVACGAAAVFQRHSTRRSAACSSQAKSS